MHLDIQFATEIMGSLPFAEIKRSKGDFRINARCPVCGDSRSDIYKKRFWIYPSKKGDHMNCGCFNCGYNKPLSVFMKDYHPDDYQRYLMESFKDRQSQPVREPEPAPVKQYINSLQFCDRLDTLPDNHPIIRYVVNRCIPKDKFNRLWFTRDWQSLVNSVNEGSYRSPKPEPRLVIPIFDKDGKIESFQGRALRDDAKAKYMTIKANEHSTKVYGQDTINSLKPVYLLEGPLDSLFVDNAGAITGGQMALADVPYKNMRVWVLDNEGRHEDTTARLKQLIDSGEKVVMWDKSPWPSKDINEMIKDDGATRDQIMEYLRNNTVSGLSAQLRFNAWCKAPAKQKFKPN
ncbi:DNA primase [Pantoea phage Phynn]|nr:DNA primase [Pantoea phage Phynn]